MKIGWQGIAKEEFGGFSEFWEELWGQQGNQNAGLSPPPLLFYLPPRSYIWSACRDLETALVNFAD